MPNNKLVDYSTICIGYINFNFKQFNIISISTLKNNLLTVCTLKSNNARDFILDKLAYKSF